eukprot:scaffold4488_cov358-Prasinococcus_capsulatus_cf.AAC.3
MTCKPGLRAPSACDGVRQDRDDASCGGLLVQVLQDLVQGAVPAARGHAHRSATGAAARATLRSGPSTRLHTLAATCQSPVADRVLEVLVHLRVRLLEAARLEYRVPPEVGRAARRHNPAVGYSFKHLQVRSTTAAAVILICSSSGSFAATFGFLSSLCRWPTASTQQRHKAAGLRSVGGRTMGSMSLPGVKAKRHTACAPGSSKPASMRLRPSCPSFLRNHLM